MILITATPGPTTPVPTLAPSDKPTVTPSSTSTKAPPTPTNTLPPTLVPTVPPTPTPTVVSDYALSFNGGSDYVSIPKSGSMNIGTSFTIEAWVKPASLASTGTFKGIVRGAVGAPPGDAGGAFVLYLDQSDPSNWGLSVCTPGCNAATSGPGSLKVNQWQFLAGTYDGSTITIYLNGNQVASQPLSGAVMAYNYLVIGLWGSSFNGLIDEVRLWTVVRSHSEVQADQSSAPSGSVPGLAGYWRFNEGSGQTVADSTNNHNNGVLGAAGDPAWVLAHKLPIFIINPHIILPILPVFPTATP